MSVPSTAVAMMDYVWLGQPFVRNEPKAAAATQGLDYSFLGQPLVATELAAATTDTEFATTASAASNFIGETAAVVAADATVTATATASFDSQTVTVISSDSDSTCALITAWDSQAIAQSSASTSAALTVSADANSTATSDFADALSTTASMEGSALSSSVFDSAPLLATAFAFNATATADVSSSLTAAFAPEAAGVLGFDVSSSIGATVSWDGVGRLMSSADATSVLSLSTSFDSAFSTVIGSTWTSIINQAVGPVVSFAVASGGTGYTNGQQIRLLGGNNDCILQVLSQSGGTILTLGFITAGTGYTTGTYATQRVTGSTGTGCTINVTGVSFNAVLWRSGATKGSVWSPAPALTPTWRSLSFAATTSSTTASVTADMVSGATAGSVASTTDSAFADWQGIAIGPVPVDLMAYLTSNVSWSGEAIRRLIVAQLRGAASTPVALKGTPTVIHLRGD